MERDQLRKIVAHILKEAKAPGTTHERLRSELAAWAEKQGYLRVYQHFANGAIPDVLRSTQDDSHLFVGDAKDASNETPDNAETLQRIWTYVKEFAGLLGDPRYKGGTIAIATNSAQAASQWVLALNLLARMAKITGPNGSAPAFRIEEIQTGKTWVVHW
ncbi:MAG: hypothetical protein RBU21_25565 [FCB group bacterium]|jgi:hypothetical protein|nr:hypothetical protein [FCB group bacterium]